jgi:hypothetical protein
MDAPVLQITEYLRLATLDDTVHRSRQSSTQASNLWVIIHACMLLAFAHTGALATYFISERPKQKTSWFPKVTPHAPNTLQTPSRKHLSFWGRVKQSIWAIGSRLRESDIKYAVKAGMATALLAAPAFFDRTRPIFVQYRGEWALISVCRACPLRSGPPLTAF